MRRLFASLVFSATLLAVAVPIVAVVCAKSFGRGRPLMGFFVRKEAKDHGTARLVDGNLVPGARAAILEDVTTTGASAMRAIEAVRSAGAAVVKVISVVDRQEGAIDTFGAHGLPFEAVFTRVPVPDDPAGNYRDMFEAGYVQG